MIVQGILDGFFNLYGISHQKTFQYLQKIANANGYQLKRPLSTSKVSNKRYLAGGNASIDTIQSLISLIFVFLAYIVNTKTIQSYSQYKLKELQNNPAFNTNSKKVIQNFLKSSPVYLLKDKSYTDNDLYVYKNEFIKSEQKRETRKQFLQLEQELEQERDEDPSVSQSFFQSIQSVSPSPSSNPENSPISELLSNELLIDLPELTEIESKSLESVQSIVSSIFPIASDESDSETEDNLVTSSNSYSNENILEEAFKSAGEIINQVSAPLSTIQEASFENVLSQVNRYSGQSIVRRNINRIEDEIKRQELQKLQSKSLPKKLKNYENVKGGYLRNKKRLKSKSIRKRYKKKSYTK